ncbi:DNA primase [Halpernia frigidisoli]|uniref:DNA primase n=1 Tax=Halpernia frigidisoli TaxID=1125876 RepID=A0A1I3IKK3_9FLAO|nr:DNA primase [Halpernia frigidisoli]SFI48441.1 DNA primase [Halpernia frigidisoli]
MISKSTIDKIFSTIRVEEIIGEYVQLKRAGSNFKGLSPFHDEKTASFVVSPSKQIWKDFSSGKGGTAISFLMEIEQFTYPEALKHAAKKYGIEVEEDIREYSEEEKQSQTDRELLYKIHEVANNFYQEQMRETEEGQIIGFAYFKERELRDDIIKKFQLGYSPEQRDAFTEYALEKGYNKEILEKSGLSIFPEYAEKGVDRFRERVMFPILSFSGRVLGFGARILKNNVKAAKYLNSPETEIYHKSKVLYGLSQSKQAISKENLCLLTEGYMDVIALHQVGIENVVASSGTALTNDQIKLIKRLTENVTILFDGDAAGIKASFRSIDLLLAEGMNIRILLFPDGDDPDSFSRKHPKDFVENFIKTEAQDFVEFKADILLEEAGNDLTKQIAAIKSIVESLSYYSELKKDFYFTRISKRFGISEKSLFNEMALLKQKKVLKEESELNRKLHIPTKLEKVADVIAINPLLILEEKLVELMLKYGDQILEKERDLEETEDENSEENKTEKYQITVIEEIINHLEEDNYEIQIALNQKIVDDIKSGLQNKEIRNGDFFLTLMDEEVTSKVANSLMTVHELSNWEQHNIYFKREDELVQNIVQDVIFRHKREFVLTLINETRKKLENPDSDFSQEDLKKIMLLTQLKNQIDKELNRIV